MPRFEVDVSDRKPIGNTGETVSAVGLGTWAIRDYRGALRAYIEAFSLGIDNVDTAEMYDDGKAERFVGELARIVGRDRIFITTKLLPHRFRSRDSSLKAMKLSLERLGVSSVDLTLIHWPDTLAAIEDQARNLEALVFEGLTRYIGVSNFTVEELETARQALRRYDIVVNQVKYSILDKSVEEELLQYAMLRGITIQAYTPLERGEVLAHKTVNEIARKRGKTPAQVALNYLISRPRVIAIPKAEKGEHVREIAGAMGWRLSPEDIEVLETT
ncbi:MAG: aldo/keto reductase [Thermoprotei archaeon]|nr:aldo/keto reductase [Thermoprotei archaeon]